jgi:hypothetical protein
MPSWPGLTRPSTSSFHDETHPAIPRAERKLLKRINVIWPVQSHLQKYSASRFTQISSLIRAVPSHSEGRLAIVMDAGRDAVDVAAS